MYKFGKYESVSVVSCLYETIWLSIYFNLSFLKSSVYAPNGRRENESPQPPRRVFVVRVLLSRAVRRIIFYSIRSRPSTIIAYLRINTRRFIIVVVVGNSSNSIKFITAKRLCLARELPLGRRALIFSGKSHGFVVIDCKTRVFAKYYRCRAISISSSSSAIPIEIGLLPLFFFNEVWNDTYSPHAYEECAVLSGATHARNTECAHAHEPIAIVCKRRRIEATAVSVLRGKLVSAFYGKKVGCRILSVYGRVRPLSNGLRLKNRTNFFLNFPSPTR